MVIFLLILGLIGLWIGSEQIVDASKAIAKRFGLSELLIGITIVSIGTSLPEIMVTIFSGAKGSSDVAIGSMIGSCLAQITVILGISAIFHKVHAVKKSMYIDAPMMLIGILIFGLFLFTDAELTRFEGFIMIIIYIAYIIYTFRSDQIVKEKKELGKHQMKDYGTGLRSLQFIIGMAILLYSAHLVLNSSVEIAKIYGLSEAFIGVMIIGTASCLPELSTAIVGSFKKSPSIAVGTLIGSNITDPLLSTGIGGMIQGFKTNIDFIRFDIPFWFISSLIAVYLMFRKGETLYRHQAIILILIYLLYVLFKIEIIQIPNWIYLF